MYVNNIIIVHVLLILLYTVLPGTFEIREQEPEEQDILLVMQCTGISRALVVSSLKRNNYDIVNALLELG